MEGFFKILGKAPALSYAKLTQQAVASDSTAVRRNSMTDSTTHRHGLQIDGRLADFIDTQVLPGTDVQPDDFWKGYADLLSEFAGRNRALLDQRAALQGQIDDWHRANPDMDPAAYRAFLTEIGYLVPEPAPFSVENGDVDPEIATLAGPQLVVPVSNARFALNAANARWGSLYDALYGSDVMGPVPSGGFDTARARMM